MTTLYFDAMQVDPRGPHQPDEDRFILSKGHACPIQCVAFDERGYFQPRVEHFHLRGLHSMFQGYPSIENTPGIDVTPGSLGNGIVIDAGMALAAKIANRPHYTCMICGGGELQEDVCQEGANIVTDQDPDDLIVFTDGNGQQGYKEIEQTIGTSNSVNRFRAFGWRVQEICGHDTETIQVAIVVAKSTKECPSCIVCDCVKGKGAGYMENNNAWYKGMPTDEEYELIVKELEVPADDWI